MRQIPDLSGPFPAQRLCLFRAKRQAEDPTEEFELLLRESAFLRYKDGVLSLDMTGCSDGQTVQGICLNDVHDLQILFCTSSLKIFVNSGAEIFTTRIYDSMEWLQMKFESKQVNGMMEYYELAI